MPNLKEMMLILHILAGALALVVGSLVLFLPKGNRRHRLLGLVFHWAMVFNGAAALYLAVARPNIPLFAIGIFSLYMVLSGARALKPPQLLDWVLSGVMVLFGFFALGWGLWNVAKGHNFGAVMCVFAIIGLGYAWSDLRFFRSEEFEAGQNVKRHLTKMVGAYIAAFTAFLVVNNTMLPTLVAWLLPSLVGGTLIAYWRRQR